MAWVVVLGCGGRCGADRPEALQAGLRLGSSWAHIPLLLVTLGVSFATSLSVFCQVSRVCLDITARVPPPSSPSFASGVLPWVPPRTTWPRPTLPWAQEAASSGRASADAQPQQLGRDEGCVCHQAGPRGCVTRALEELQLTGEGFGQTGV